MWPSQALDAVVAAEQRVAIAEQRAATAEHRQLYWRNCAKHYKKLYKDELSLLRTRQMDEAQAVLANARDLIANRVSQRIRGGKCDVCGSFFDSVAKHQMKVKHGKIWEARRVETNSAKKKRLAGERRERMQWNRVGGESGRSFAKRASAAINSLAHSKTTSTNKRNRLD